MSNNTKVRSGQMKMVAVAMENLVRNGNFINNSTNGYGGTPDDWTNFSANPVQGGFPEITKQGILDVVNTPTADLEGLWPLNEASGNALDLSDNSYDLTDNNTVGASDDGMMAKARDFERTNTEFFTITSGNSPNLQISGAQTWFALVKPEQVGIANKIMGIRASGGGTARGLIISSENKVGFRIDGLTDTEHYNPVTIEADKWYFIVGVYSGTQLKVYVNGVEDVVSSSGTATALTENFSIGRWGAHNDGEFDGLIQLAGVINGALTYAEIKRLWAYTMYKGIKLRRNGSDCAIYQYIDKEDNMTVNMERLRGKTITLRAKMWQETASTGYLKIKDIDYAGTTTRTESDAVTTTDEWVEVYVTRTIPDDAIELALEFWVDDTNANVWIEEVALYEADMDLGYIHSPDDWKRFPRLLQMDIPQFIDGTKPYQFEENRKYTWDPTYTGFSTDPAASTNPVFWFNGTIVWIEAGSLNGTSNSATFDFTLPITATQQRSGYSAYPASVYNNSTWQDTVGIVGIPDGDTAKVGIDLSSRSGNSYGGFTASNGKGVSYLASYQIA